MATHYYTVTWDQLHRDARALAWRLMPLRPLSGIVAITRKREREALNHLAGEPCAVCQGAGHTRSTQSVALDLIRRVERQARATPGREILAEAAPEVAAWLNARLDEITPALARRGAGRVRFAAGAFGREVFDVRSL